MSEQVRMGLDLVHRSLNGPAFGPTVHRRQAENGWRGIFDALRIAQMAEVMVPGTLFQQILDAITALRPSPPA